MFIIDIIVYLFAVLVIILPLYYIGVVFLIIDGYYDTRKGILMAFIPYYTTFKAMQKKFYSIPWE